MTNHAELCGCSIKVDISDLTLRITVTKGDISTVAQASLYYIKGHVEEAPPLCTATTSEFYKMFYTDYGSTHAYLHGSYFLVYSLQWEYLWIKIFVVSEGYVGALVVDADKNVFYTPGLLGILNTEEIGGITYVESLQR